MCFKQVNLLLTFLITLTGFAQSEQKGGPIHIEGLIVGAENQTVELFYLTNHLVRKSIPFFISLIFCLSCSFSLGVNALTFT